MKSTSNGNKDNHNAGAPLIAIVGPTASGKSSLGLNLAAAAAGEIIAADSRTIYRRLNIGTAKPTAAEQVLVPHHLLDVVEPGEQFSVGSFQRMAYEAIANIAARGRLPIMVGGTGLYIDAVLYDFQFPKVGTDLKFRDQLNKMSLSELKDQLIELGVALNDSDWRNPRRLIRAIETAGQPRSKGKLRPNTLIIGLEIPRDALERRIRDRVHEMLNSGFLTEVEQLVKQYGSESEALSGIGYRAFAAVIEGRKTVERAAADFIKGDLQLAKRQMTWFKRNPDIHWVTKESQGLQLAEDFLKSQL